MTEWIATCRCDIVAPAVDEQVKTVNLCTTCKKRTNIEDTLQDSMNGLESFDPDFFSSASQQIVAPEGKH